MEKGKINTKFNSLCWKWLLYFPYADNAILPNLTQQHLFITLLFNISHCANWTVKQLKTNSHISFHFQCSLNHSYTLDTRGSSALLGIIETLRSTIRETRRHGLQNVKKQCEFKHLKEATINWLPYMMFQACFMTSKTHQLSSNDCSVWAEVDIKEQLSSLGEFTERGRHWE